MKRRVKAVAVAVGMVGALGAWACGSDSDCAETRTCGSGSGGTAGAAGSAGSSGASGSAGAAQTCTGSAECDDGLACNGVETCAAGKCAAGTPIDCANPDPLHCSATCTEQGGGTCLIAGLDADGDTHGDAACTAAGAAGDDCDDGNKDVFPGAVEVCDGLDGDCDGLDDLAEGMSLGGSPGDFVVSPSDAEQPSIAWSDTAQSFAVVWEDLRDGDPEIYFVRMDPSGAKIGSELRLTPEPNDSEAPQIAWGGDVFGVVFSDTSYGNKEIAFLRVDATGAAIGTMTRVSNGAGDSQLPTIARVGTEWLIAWLDYRSGSGQLYGRVLNADGSYKSAEAVLSTTAKVPLVPRLAAAGSAGVGVWMEDTNSNQGSDAVRWGAIDGSPKVANAVWLSDNPSATGEASEFPVLAANAEVQIAAWAHFSGGPTSRLRASEMKPDGTVLCTAPEIASVSGTLGIFPGAAVLHPNGAALVHAQADASGGTVSLQLSRSKADGTCSFQGGTAIATGIGSGLTGGRAAMAYGASGFAVVWAEQTGSAPLELRRRVFGPSYCD